MLPNWVYNRIRAEGPAGLLDQVASALSGTSDTGEAVPVSFNSLIPRPDEEDENWYDWNVVNWGTKWDAHRPELSVQDGPGGRSCSWTFETAWSPPEPVYQALAARFPQVALTFSFEEETGWGGRYASSGGVLALEESYEPPSSHGEMVARGWSCWCEHAEPVFEDCWELVGAEYGIDDPEVFKVAARLQPDWSGSFEELLRTAEGVLRST